MKDLESRSCKCGAVRVLKDEKKPFSEELTSKPYRTFIRGDAELHFTTFRQACMWLTNKHICDYSKMKE